MMKLISRLWLAGLLAIAMPSFAQDDAAAGQEPEDSAPIAEAAGDDGGDEADAEPVPVDPNAPKVLSGMSILGNEEAPKSLVIIPWKSSEIGSDLGLADGLDDSAQPVDKEVFLRELAFYKIRAGQ